MENRTFKYTNRDFECIRQFVLQNAGIVLDENKKEMVYSRLCKILRKKNIDSFKDYVYILGENKEVDIMECINALTTNVTHFFREEHHFQYLKEVVLPEITKAKKTRRIRIWSAGCSTGQEPYSLAILLQEYFSQKSGYDVKILATDIDQDALKKAGQAIYSVDCLKKIHPELIAKYFISNVSSKAGEKQVCKQIREMITFRRLNLFGEWPMRSSFDVIFCRNVMIYFDQKTNMKLIADYAAQLVTHGHLFIGHSETIGENDTTFENVGKTIYRKCK